MELIHTLLFFIREKSLEHDLDMIGRCLKSLEKSTYTTVVVFNQGCLSNEELSEYLKIFSLNCIVIGNAENKGTVVGRQSCFEYVYRHFPEAVFVSELHPDMIFASNWEDALLDYLKNNDDEPMVGCGIVSDPVILGLYPHGVDYYLSQFKSDRIEQGLTIPCIHKIEVLKAVEGYDSRFLTGMQAFEDDSLLVGYHYYYGTRINWVPKINYNSVVYHAVAGQRFGLNDNLYANYDGLVRQYGAKGIQVLANIHISEWQARFFADSFSALTSNTIK